MPDSVRQEADADAPLPIGHGQTNSQPYTVQLMLDWLDVQPGENVLDIGSGSGWTTALLSHLTGPSGQVIAVEKVPELVNFGRDNCQRAGIENVDFHEATDEFGWPASGPYQRILVSAAAVELPEELIKQLTTPGRLVIPINDSIWVIDKSDNGIKRTEHAGFRFVPLI